MNVGGGNSGDNENIEMQLLRNRESDRPIILNVGGKKYEVSLAYHCCKYVETWGQFHQYFTRIIYVSKLHAQLFCAYVLGLYFTDVSLPAQKLHVEH